MVALDTRVLKNMIDTARQKGIQKTTRQRYAYAKGNIEPILKLQLLRYRTEMQASHEKDHIMCHLVAPLPSPLSSLTTSRPP